jgi:N-acetyl-anhydromuramyl-L-alanine amidase AmpD
MTYPFIESPNCTRLGGRAVDLVVIHTMEIREHPGAAEACARWFSRPDAAVSAHYCVDADSIVQCVREEDIAWHARGGNASSIGIELAGYARQSPAGWDDPYSVAMLRLTAPLTAELCARYGIPVRWLRVEQVRERAAGITGHDEISRAFGLSDHWDPGPAFPVDRFLRLVRRSAARLRTTGGETEKAVRGRPHGP